MRASLPRFNLACGQGRRQRLGRWVDFEVDNISIFPGGVIVSSEHQWEKDSEDRGYVPCCEDAAWLEHSVDLLDRGYGVGNVRDDLMGVDDVELAILEFGPLCNVDLYGTGKSKYAAKWICVWNRWESRDRCSL